MWGRQEHSEIICLAYLQFIIIIIIYKTSELSHSNTSSYYCNKISVVMIMIN